MIHGIIKFFKLVVVSVLLVVVVGGAVTTVIGVMTIKNLAADLPPVTPRSYKPSLTTKILDVNGVVLDELFGDELRTEIVALKDIPKRTQLAFIAIEDQRFYQHYGIDPKRILGALLADLRARRIVEGGSTLTQQLAKNRFLTRERTIKRKIQEMILAFRLERTFTKDEILAAYLNEILFGERIHGIGSAAKYYFGKEVKNLDLAESAVLGGLPKAPNLYSPFNKAHPNMWKERQKLVLMRMAQLGFITEKDRKAAEAETLHFSGGDPHSATREARYFVEHVKKQLLEKFGYKRVFSEGLRVHTTLDIDVERMAEKAFLGADVFKDKPVEDFPSLQGAFVALDPTDGAIRAMIGGRDFATYKFNRATQSFRQPGSAFKPFVYGTAFSMGISPNLIMEDAPYSHWDPGAQRYWEPHNYGNKYSGPVVLATALEKSINVIAVKLIEKVGVVPVIDFARRCGVTSPLVPNLTLALGSSEVCLLEMASAYGTIANQGIRVQPRSILRVEDSGGQPVFEAESVEREAMSEQVAFILAHTMTGVVDRGTGHVVRKILSTDPKLAKIKVAGKTGTNQDHIDAWFLGYTPDVVAGCTIGYDDRQSLGKGATGGSLAAPIVGEFLKAYFTKFPTRDFHPPRGVDVVNVCRASGLLPGSGCGTVLPMAFLAGKAPKVHDSGESGSADDEGDTEDDAEDDSAPGDTGTGAGPGAGTGTAAGTDQHTQATGGPDGVSTDARAAAPGRADHDSGY